MPVLSNDPLPSRSQSWSVSAIGPSKSDEAEPSKATVWPTSGVGSDTEKTGFGGAFWTVTCSAHCTVVSLAESVTVKVTVLAPRLVPAGYARVTL